MGVMTVFEQKLETFLSKWVEENIGSEIAIGSTSFGGNTIIIGYRELRRDEANRKTWLECGEDFAREVEKELGLEYEVSYSNPDYIRLERIPSVIPCCENEDRTMSGGCRNCGDPCL